MKTTIVTYVAGLTLAAALLLPAPVPAQTTQDETTPGGTSPVVPATAGAEPLTGLWLTTPIPEFSVPPGEPFTVPLTLRNANLPPQRAELEVSGLPEGWTWTITSGAREVRAAIVAPNESQELTLEVTPPADAVDAAPQFDVAASIGEDTSTLPLAVSFAEEAAGGIELEPELPALRGTATSTFTYRVELTNDSAEEALFNLAAQTHPGFETTFKRGYGSEEITGVPVEAGASETVTLEVKPAPDGIEKIESVADGRWKVVATRDVRPDLARHIVTNGGNLISLDAHRIGLGEAYNRFFREVRHEA